MSNMPTGTLTFLFTDIEGSTRLWERHPDAMRHACSRHDALVEACVSGHEGALVRPRGEGDSRFAVFVRAADALAAACDLQCILLAEPWPSDTQLKVRMALHTGDAHLRDGDYYGSAVNRCARLRSLACGGQILLSQTTYDLAQDALPEGVTLMDLGKHRLKDLGRPERVFQLCYKDLPWDFPPLRSLDCLPNNLPVQLTSFIGRERELAEIKGLLGSRDGQRDGGMEGPTGSAASSAPRSLRPSVSASRLLTLTGSGGSGKSRLSLQVAAELLVEYTEGVWLVELAALTDPGLVPPAVAQTLGVLLDGSKPIQQALIDYLKPKSLLLILDNCEHLLDACAALVDALLRSCPELAVLASSREGLGIAGETIYRMPSLGVPPADVLTGMVGGLPSSAEMLQAASLQTVGDRLAQYDAVRLFVERAGAAQPGFRVTQHNARPLVDVCRRLDGIPLAIELAAARVRVLPVEQIASRLDDVFRLLTGGSRTAMPRQQTLRALIDWSYNLLNEQEQALLRSLSEFAGGWTLEAAEAVCGCDGDPTPTHPHTHTPLQPDEVLDLLTSLVDKSLVTYEEGAERYRLLETVRQYARSLLREREEGEALRDRHLTFFLAFAEEAEARCKGPEQPQWLDRLEAEHDNLRAALEWAAKRGGSSAEVEAPEGIEAFARLAAALGHFWDVRGYRREGLDWMSQALAQDGLPPRLRARALEVAGNLDWRSGGPPMAVTWLEEAVELCRAIDDKDGVACSLALLSLLVVLAGEPERGKALAKESLALVQETEDRHTIARVLWIAPHAEALHGDRLLALSLMADAVARFRDLGSPGGIARSLETQGYFLVFASKAEQAQPLLEEALALGRKVNDGLVIRECQDTLARLDGRSGDAVGQITRLEEIVGLRWETDRGGEWGSRILWLVLALLRQGATDRARTLLEEGAAVPLQPGTTYVIALCRMLLSYLAQQRGDREAAWMHQVEARRLSREATEDVRPDCLANMGHAAREFGDYEQARSLYAECLGLRQKQNDPVWIAASLEDHAALAAFESKHLRAAQLFGAAEAVAEAAGRLWRCQGIITPAEAACRATLGEETFTAAWAQGRTMNLEQAVEVALEGPDGPRSA